MRIDIIECINYRQYKYLRLDFRKKTNYDLHVIKGKNGMGKTNILNAIDWCLYHEESHLAIQNKGKPKLNTQVLNEAKENGIEKCEIKVRVSISEENGTSTTFEKKLYQATDNCGFEYKPQVSVTIIQGENTQVYTDMDTYNSYVQRYFPSEIKEYFFFNGEHLEKYFITGQGEKIKEAIHVISQVHILTCMLERLDKVIKDLEIEAGKKSKNIDELVNKKNDLNTEITNLSNILKELNSQIIISDDVIKQCNEFLRGKEGVPEKEKEFEELQNEINNKIKEKTELEVDINKFIRRYKTLFAFYPAIKHTYTKIIEKEIEGAFPPVIDKDYLNRMLKSHKCLVCNRDLGEHDEKSVLHLLDKITISSKPIQTLLTIKGELENLLDETKEYKVKRDKLFERKKSLDISIEKSEDKLDNLDKYLKNFTDKEKIKDTHQKRMDNIELVKSNRSRIIKLDYQVEEMNAKLKSLEEQIEKARKSNEECKDINKKIDFARKAKDIVKSTENEMMDDAREKMRVCTMELFERLEWKKESFNHIELDKNYNLELFDNDGFPTVGTCSAGERSLLALSFTLALQEVSGYDSMLFIDTPVGRIDTENRAKFADVLKDVSKNKQIILTFTTSEYSKEIKNVFEPVMSSFVELYTDNEKVTSILSEVIS